MSVAELQQLAQRLKRLKQHHPLVLAGGSVASIQPAGITIKGLSRFLSLGDVVQMGADVTQGLCEVIKLEEQQCLVRSYDKQMKVHLGQRARLHGRLTISPTTAWRGRIVDALGRPVDHGGPLETSPEDLNVDGDVLPALQRAIIKRPIKTGVRAIDIFTPLAEGQRIGIFAGSGVGKSTLLSMIGAAERFTTIVTVLVGERGREVREFSETVMRSHGSRMVAVVSTSDETPMMRRMAPRTGMRIAEYFRDRGETVLLVMDSVTRYAHACRDVALSAGEAPVARGYPPSVFSELPHLLERAGPGVEGQGSITGLFAVLIDGDDHNDPVADAIRGTLDGHIVLNRRIAEQGRYPAIDLLASLSRLSHLSWDGEQRQLVLTLTALINRFENARDLVSMGAYQPGQDHELDKAMLVVPKLYTALQQTPHSPAMDPTMGEAFAAVLAELPQGLSPAL